MVSMRSAGLLAMAGCSSPAGGRGKRPTYPRAYCRPVAETWREVGDRVFVRRHASLDLNVGLVVGDGACLVVDTRCSTTEGRDLVDAVRRVTSAPWVVVNTHAHFDHCFGNASFLPAAVWSQRGCAAALSSGGEATRARIAGLYEQDGQPEVAAEIAATPIVVPDHLVDVSAVLDVGGRPVELAFLGRGHTDHDLVVRLSGVVFAGDLVEEGAPPQFRDAYPLDWPETVGALDVAAGTAVVPGHGDVVDAAFVRGQREVLADLVRVAVEGHAEGRPAGDVAAAVPGLGDFALQAAERAYWQLEGGGGQVR